ncbi:MULTISPECIES: ATP-binding protein [unclassified Clostridium]|uniref:HAMP domain-containing sensor histidine kinase n=1 Tax=unclassified Clostridium TaxID=2614128 RepID=UPI0002D49A8B|nr:MULTISPECIES: ATP-binding protein [unclassified Clostridium]MBN1038119.1 PAS domain-containing sensor histidine kinase [Clostridium botulinum]MBN1051548.1 PAS domain-containing sensor histidine kinase [Clostridium botulinum]MBN1054776.1 PAS domain-containing sensor histidine kinase [Clostridium botulinum]NFN93078.1 HAMP domain-containing histidine kinase [Clostridium botulinum]NFS96299.1 HAMP domain-containing histidine kinase [Clostridium botulinum]
MKKKILISSMMTVFFAIIIVTSFFVLLSNVQQIRDTKEELRNFNLLVGQLGNPEQVNNVNNTDLIKINNIPVKFTLLDAKGEILYDTQNEVENNYKNNKEFQEAMENGEGSSTKYSEDGNLNVIYYATKLSDNTIVVSWVPVNIVKTFQNKNIKYCIGIIMVVMFFSISLCLKLIKMIITPIKDLESVTHKMANGDYKIRAKINSKDELGNLGESFNNMADQLQMKMHEIVDKQTRIESILRSMESGVIAVDNNNIVIAINPYAERIFGIKKNILGESIIEYISDYDINTFLEEDYEIDKEIKILHPIERDLKIKKSNIINGIEMIGKVITIQDITDIKKLELMRTQFVANVSHELKTPLTSIKGFAETLRYVEDNETREKFLNIIDKESERLSRLINDILVLSSIESNISTQNDEFLPKSIIEDVINMVRKLANNKAINLEFYDDNQELILGDKDKFYQLTLNLVENAIKYSENGSNVKVISYSKQGNYYLEISDNGLGIPKEDLPRIFERFYRVDKSRKKGGTGLGLAIVKHIVKTFNGDINVKSILGEGSIFKVRIKYK